MTEMLWFPRNRAAGPIAVVQVIKDDGRRVKAMVKRVLDASEGIAEGQQTSLAKNAIIDVPDGVREAWARRDQLMKHRANVKPPTASIEKLRAARKAESSMEARETLNAKMREIEDAHAHELRQIDEEIAKVTALEESFFVAKGKRKKP